MRASFESDLLNHEGCLESQDIIELHAFIERRTWIEEKIRFLESLQPIELFSDDGELPASEKTSHSVSAAQLAEWLAEHEKIERETEVFDSGDLQKLKGFTKAATRRNLSAKDTDLIELALTTIYALDKLLQLLRDRSEKLDLLSLRLKWEEHRISCWTQRQTILNELRSFLHTYAEMYINVYRNHMTSMRNCSSGASHSARSLSAPFPASNSKLSQVSENMALEASSLFKRIMALKEGDVTVSAQILDKLVNDSCVPVPEFFLDEQDRIDDECGMELIDLGDFAISIAMHWRKAYDFHNELLKDEQRVYEILQDLKGALSQHPNGIQNSSFISRLDDFKLLLQSRNISTISELRHPQCVNLLIPEQMELNKSIFQTLHAQLCAIVESSKEAESLAKNYNEAWETVKRYDDLFQRLQTTQRCLENIEEDLRNGAFLKEYINLLEPKCLENEALPEYLSKTTSVLEYVSETELTATKLIQSARQLSMEQDRPGVDLSLRQSLIKSIDAIKNKCLLISRLKAELSEHVDHLRQIYPMYSVIQGCMIRVTTTIGELQEAMYYTQWLFDRVEIENNFNDGAGILCLPSAKMELHDHSRTLDDLRLTYETQIVSSLSTTNQLPSKFMKYLRTSSSKLLDCLDKARSLNALSLKLSDQIIRMKAIQFDVSVLEARVTKFNKYLERHYTRTLTELLKKEDVFTSRSETLFTMKLLRKDIQEFLEALSRRTPLIAGFHDESVLHLTIDPIAIDEVVRLRCNAYSIRLSGHLRILEGNFEKMTDLTTKIEHFDHCTSSFKLTLQNLTLQQNDMALELTNLKQQVFAETNNSSFSESILSFIEKSKRTVSSHQSEIEILCITARQAVAHLQSWKLIDDEDITFQFIGPRLSTMDELEKVAAKFNVKSKDLYADLDTVIPSTSLPDQSLHKILEHIENLDKINDDSQHPPKDNHFLVTDIVDGIEEKSVNEAEADLHRPSNETGEIRAAGNKPVSPPRKMIAVSKPINQLNDSIDSIRSRLRLISSDAETLDFTQHRFTTLPNDETNSASLESLAEISDEIQRMILSGNSSMATSELSYLSVEAKTLSRKLYLMECLSKFLTAVRNCDNDLSDLLNFIDNFETTSFEGVECDEDFIVGSEKQMLERLGRSEGLLSFMSDMYLGVDEDPLAILEYKRLFQTWSELKEMALDRIHYFTSRPLSSRNSIKDDRRFERRKSSASGQVMMSAPHTKDMTLLLPKRNISSFSTEHNSTVPLNFLLKKRSNRSVSGPMTSSLYSSTFSSRQRTASLTSTSSVMRTPVILKPERISGRRADSPANSESSFKSNIENFARTKPHNALSKTSRMSLKSVHRDLQIQQSGHGQRHRRKYVANPNNKLDVAVGNVVNCLPVDINIQAVADTWKDQSGKYWIGDAEPRLCFCRILRSQTVMVRVGGGWTELSKFIQSHFADLFELIPKPRTPEIKEVLTSERPATPERSMTDLPSFILSTPNKGSPHSLRSASSASSPLTPLQFMRRADIDAPDLSSLSLSKGSIIRSNVSNFNTPTRAAVWRP